MNMSRKFRFDDEDDFFGDDQDQFPKVKENINSQVKQESVFEEDKYQKTREYQFNDTFDLDEFEEIGEDEVAKKGKNKRKGIKTWQIVLIVIMIPIVLFFGYIFFLTTNDGPVFGNRCEGLTAINIDAKTSTVNAMKKKYSSIKDMSIEIICRQIKVDIEFKDKMKVSDAKKIAEESVKLLDDNVGLPKNGKTYSNLLGYIKNEAQYDVELYMLSNNSSDFPIYGTKHHSKQSFSYTYASVKHKDSKNKAENTLKK